ncbi:hypothetical protein J2Z21_002937 [Streptomyces griseochromogenes]|uniref:Secreted protein n=1 Tax=Streptomyces griseochromogenes TaxID=68214 RepID=A0A1B1AXQ6_9ACTN|nr:hypothetical protein [Streptomyces griseochromogenes]ANP51302.1 hypothetical protein AVL59_18235 [Streptomyces griseochromogenes]MBP2050001.1 hypothetical protein [Streptomyces griseochromogenes]
MRGSLVGTAVTLAAGAMLTAAMTTASASPPAATAPKAEPSQPVLVDCFWNRNVRPTDFILACGDGNSRLIGLHWTRWSPDTATAVGVNAVNDCKPYCAAGTFRSYRVTVRLDRPEPWKKHPDVLRYGRMSLTYEGARPDGFKNVVIYPLWD